MKRQIISIILCLMAICAINAQSKKQSLFEVAGTVSDANETMVGVAVTIIDKPTVGTVTDIDGHFSIKAEKGDKILFSFVGYKKYTYVATESVTDLKISLQSDNEIDEVVVTALGKQRKISQIAAVTSVNVSDLQRPTTSVANLMGGRVAGVISSMGSGEPGKNISDFWIRGIGTFGANASALVLIDGLEGNINDLDPADIESFSILKDASATAVYGVRGANGVVLITTKRGTTDRIQITGRASVTINHLSRLPEYADAYNYALLANEARAMRNETPLYDNVALDIIKYNLDPDIYPNVCWQDEIIKRNSLSQNYYVSARGGSNVAKYFISLGANVEDAAYKVDKDSPYASNVGYNRYTYRTNLDLRLTPTTTVYFGSDGTLTSNNTPGVVNTDYIWQAQSEINPLRLPTMYSNGQYPAVGADAGTSPYVMINRMGRRSTTKYEGKATLAIDQDLSFITKGLKIRAQGAFDISSEYNEARLI
ncbi:MAG: SusC/RagA family TonB-linked outer membrane protein, partial [Muribaculaceae bacterium]